MSDDFKKLGALNAEDDPVHRLDFWHTDKPKCPHCGVFYDIHRHDAWDLYSEDEEHTVTCPECDWDFVVVTTISYAFSTDEQPEPEDETP